LINKKYTVKEWLPYKEVFENGIIKLKNNSLAKIIKITPINFNLKSDIEKQAILNSYKVFLKTCNFNLQILIQSNKEDLSYHFSKLKKSNKKVLSQKYIEYLEKTNKNQKSSSKNFYIIIKEFQENKKNIENEKILCEKLNENYFKIKECLLKCGNFVKEINEKEEVEKILYSFLNTRKDLNIIWNLIMKNYSKY